MPWASLSRRIVQWRTQFRNYLSSISLPTLGTSKPINKDAWGFRFTYWGFWLALFFGWYALGSDSMTHLIFGIVLLFAAMCQLIAGMWLWFGTGWAKPLKWVLTLMGIGWVCWISISDAHDLLSPTYLCILPSRELADAERRAFFVQIIGRKTLSQARIVVQDNKSLVSTPHIEIYNEPLSSDGDNPRFRRYFWFTPSSPWNEDYTIAITAQNAPSVVENLVVRSTHHSLQLALDVHVNDKLIQSCRDSLIPPACPIGRYAKQTCGDNVSVSPMWQGLQPPPDIVQNADDSVIDLLNKKLPPPDTNAQSEIRNLFGNIKKLRSWQPLRTTQEQS